jgi:hypothetical protein
MGERRDFRTATRTDTEILGHAGDMYLLAEISRRRVRVEPGLRADLRRLARDTCILAGFGRGSVPTLLPRGERLLAAHRGELAAPAGDGPA